MPDMNAEIAAYDASIRTRLEGAVACLDGLTESQLNWRPAIDGANSAYALAAHTLGSARAWVLGIACGRDIGRDRPAEFRATGADAARLRDDLARLSARSPARWPRSLRRNSTAASSRRGSCGAKALRTRSRCATR